MGWLVRAMVYNESVKGTRRPLAVLKFRFYQGSAASFKLSERRAPVTLSFWVHKAHIVCYRVQHETLHTRNPEKNKIIKKERNVGFEDVVFHIETGDEVDILEHPNKEHYPNQKISVVLIEGYAYLVHSQHCYVG